jgi:hypothetical protein
LYFILFHGIFEIEAFKYMLARGVQFSVICFSIHFHYDYYKAKFLVQEEGTLLYKMLYFKLPVVIEKENV